MTSIRTFGLAFVALLAAGCTQEVGDDASSNSAALDPSGEGGKRPPVLLADLVGMRPGDGLVHILVPFVLPPPHRPGVEGEKPKPFCVVLPKPEAKKPPPGDKCEGEKPKPMEGAGEAKPPRMELIKADGKALPISVDELAFEEGDGFAIDVSESKKPPMHGPTILQIAVFDKPLAPKAGEPPQPPDAVVQCFAPPDAPRIEIAPKTVHEILEHHHIEGAVARVAIAHFPPPPKAKGEGGPEGGKPPMPMGGEKPEGAPLCHPPVVGHGTFTMVPLHPKDPKPAVMKPIATEL